MRRTPSIDKIVSATGYSPTMEIPDMIKEIIKYKNKPLKILITVGIFPPDIGGPASFVPKIAELYVNSDMMLLLFALLIENKLTIITLK